MGTNWVLENLLKALATWTEKMQEIWTLLTTSPQEFRGGTIWSMDPFTAHQLRHTYATMLYDADVDVKTAQKLLGHKDLSVTMKIYTHLSEKKEAIGIERLNNHLNGTPDQQALMNA